MSGELVLQTVLTKESSFMDNCLNIETIYNGDANNNTTIHNSHYHFSAEEKYLKVKQHDAPKTVDQTVLYMKVFPNDKELLKLLWKHLSLTDKFNCSLVCKRFNQIVSLMDCFRLVANLSSRYRVFPRLSRVYKTVSFSNYHCNSLEDPMLKLLDHLSLSVVNLKLDRCVFNLITLSEIVRKLPLLESLELNVILTMEKDVELLLEDVPKPLQLKHLNINVNGCLLEELLNMLGSASNIQSLSLSDEIVGTKMLDRLKQYQRSLESLSFTKCIIDELKQFSNLNTLHFNSILNIQLDNYSCFDCLPNLRVLHLCNCDMLRIFETKEIHRLTEFKVKLSLLNTIPEVERRLFLFYCQQRVLKYFSNLSPGKSSEWKVQFYSGKVFFVLNNIKRIRHHDFISDIIFECGCISDDWETSHYEFLYLENSHYEYDESNSEIFGSEGEIEIHDTTPIVYDRCNWYEFLKLIIIFIIIFTVHYLESNC